MNLKQIFGQNIRTYRKLRQMSQECLAEKLDISTKHLSTMETGKVFASAELIERLAAALQVSASALFFAPGEKSFDQSDYSKTNAILEEECKNMLLQVQKRLCSL